MAAQDYFDAPVAYNPDVDALVANAVFQVFATTDPTFTTPLAVTDPVSGTSISELRSSTIGVLPSFKIAGAPAQVVLKSGTFATLLTSRFGLLREGGFDAETVQAAISAGQQAEDALAAIPTLAADAVDGTLAEAGVLLIDLVDEDTPEYRWDLSFPDRDTFLSFVEIPDDSPYLTWVKYNDGEFQSYVKKNGEVYPPVASVDPEPQPEVLSPIRIVSDSIAEGWASYTAELATLTGRAVSTEGIGGQQSPQIAARQGGVPAYVTIDGGILPVSGTVSVTAITEPDGTAVSPLRVASDATRTRTVVINGARCTLTGVTASGVVTYTLAQIGGTYPMAVSPGTPMVPLELAAGTITVLLGPRNDLGPSSGDAFRQTLPEITDRYGRMIARAKQNGGKVILLPTLPRTDATAEGRANLVILNNALRDLDPEDWADWLTWLKSDAAFTAAGISKTADDTTDIANGDTPRSFRQPTPDVVHLDGDGYKAANRFIALTISARGL